ncbi:hypothetical protein VNO78_21932 [Psophocarpus tetragonolobus]|uniref:Uncharacterized protein n=1 Tax=Psophocarpus tetragonolobus TaxID=3891 RepID=A0AAN9SBV9_PSOTE
MMTETCWGKTRQWCAALADFFCRLPLLQYKRPYTHVTQFHFYPPSPSLLNLFIAWSIIVVRKRYLNISAKEKRNPPMFSVTEKVNGGCFFLSLQNVDTGTKWNCIRCNS